MLNIRQLRYFTKVIETGSFTRAASALHISQPALSLQIRQLEEDLGAHLFVRGARGAMPTPGGLFLHKRSVELLNSFDDISREMRRFNASSNKKQLTLGIPPSISRQLGAQVLLDASACMPNVYLRLIEAYSAPLWEAASRGEIDVGLMYDVEKSTALEMKAILFEHFGLFERNDGRPSNDRLTPLRNVLGRKLVVHANHKSVLQALMDAAERHSLPLEVALDTQSVEAITDIVEQGFAAAVLPYGIMADAVRSGRVTAKRIIEPSLSRKLYLVRPKRRGNAKPKIDVAKFVDMIRARLIRSLGEFCQPL